MNDTEKREVLYRLRVMEIQTEFIAPLVKRVEELEGKLDKREGVRHD